mmetsp:Transcript_19042/g.40776  ORF Transcript_19042/g.40776 Transcript_19042/m.40776 type:complete len:280 (+) Transcript_19042:558-1397(+)
MTNKTTDLACLSALTAAAAFFREGSNDFLRLARANVKYDTLSIVRGDEQVPIARGHGGCEELAPLHIVPRIRPQDVARVGHQICPIAPGNYHHCIWRRMQVHHSVDALRSDDGIFVMHDGRRGRRHGRRDLPYGLGRPAVPEPHGPVRACGDDNQKTAASSAAAANHGRREDDVTAAVHVGFVPAKFLQHSGGEQAEFATRRVVTSGEYFGTIRRELDAGYCGTLVADAADPAVRSLHLPQQLSIRYLPDAHGPIRRGRPQQCPIVRHIHGQDGGVVHH